MGNNIKKILRLLDKETRKTKNRMATGIKNSNDFNYTEADKVRFGIDKLQQLSELKNCFDRIKKNNK